MHAYSQLLPYFKELAVVEGRKSDAPSLEKIVSALQRGTIQALISFSPHSTGLFNDFLIMLNIYLNYAKD